MALNTTIGAADADSYFTLDEATTYFTDRNITAWTGDDTTKEAAARRGTSYIDNQYRGRWKGVKATAAQALAWPRVDVVDSDGYDVASDAIPVLIKRAAMEAALLTLTGVSLEPRVERGGMIKSIGKGVGPLRKDIVYMDGAPAQDRLIAIEGLLSDFVTSTPGSSFSTVRLVRA